VALLVDKLDRMLRRRSRLMKVKRHLTHLRDQDAEVSSAA
jgi:hypothetical protein